RNAYFTNREKDAAHLKSNFENRVNTMLISPRRWGKSSLVEKVASQVNGKKIKVIILDLFPVRTEEEFFSLFSTAIIKATSNKVEGWIENAKLFLKQMRPKFTLGLDPVQDFEIILDWDDTPKNYKDVLSLPERIAKAKNIKIVVCIDEFQNIGNFDQPLAFQKRLRSEWQHHEYTTYCLFGSKQHMLMQFFERQSMPFYKFGEIMYLPKIEEKHWIKFITGAFERTGKSIAPQLAALIANTVKLHPYYVQQLAHLTWITTSKKATIESIHAAAENLLNQNGILYYKDTEELSATQLNFLKAVASGVTELSSKDTIRKFNLGTSANVNKIKEALLKREFIDLQMGKVVFIDPAFELWIKRTILKRSLF
ncbi:MAG TPA: ATP-binding protein, partial [Flavobacteriales bacterium]|nr:ATP-binding protein [Flavobacteriales bacterium]